MQSHTLVAQIREETGRKVKLVREARKVPATVYGKNKENKSLSISLQEFAKVYSQTGETGLIELHVGNEKLPVLIHTVQLDPVSEQILHVEFHQVDLKQKVKTPVPLVLVGEAPVVGEKRGALLTLVNELEVEALPADLPDKLEINIDSLTEVGQELKVSDIKVPSTISILAEEDTLIVKVSELVSKEAEADAAADAAAATDAATESEADKPTDAAPQAEEKVTAE